MANAGTQDTIRYVTATIANGTSLSAAVAIDGLVVVGVQMPAAWDAAGLTMQAAYDGSTYGNVFTQTTEFNATVAANQINLWNEALPPMRSIKLRSGTAGVAVNQTADRILTIICKKPGLA